MLSIDNIGLNQASTYYSEDDYYTRNLNKDDEWQGNLTQKYSNEKGFSPKDFDNALKSMPNSKRAAYDLTFSAPKSVSIAMILDNEKKADMIQAHNKAVTDTIKEIEANEIEARITKNRITERVLTGKIAVAKFNHFVSREQDMQLHTHCVVLNRTEYNGKEYAISNENLYTNKILYGQLYRNRLAKNLQDIGYSCHITDTEKGFFELDNIEQDWIDNFSTRRQQINEKLKEWGTNSALASDKATLLTRQAKINKDFSLLEKSWQKQINGKISIDKNPLKIKISTSQKNNAFNQAVDSIANQKFAFTRKELERAVLAEGCTLGMNRSDFTTHFENSDLINLGTQKNIADTTTFYTTANNIAVEEEIMSNITNTSKLQNITDAKKDLDNIISQQHLSLTSEQKQAILNIANSNMQFSAVQGLAGTGKTYMLNSTRELFEKHGYTVSGMAFTGKAAEGLGTAGIKSTTIHSFLNHLERTTNISIESDLKQTWDFSNLKPTGKELWVIDEAGTLNNNLFLSVQKAAIAKNAKILLVGDYNQFNPIGPGNAYQSLVQSGKISTSYLTDIRRQSDEILLNAVKESVSGDISKSISLLAKNIKEIKSPITRFKLITKEYTSLSLPEQDTTIVLTAKNTERNTLNESIRDALIRSGQIDINNQKGFAVISNKNEKTIKSFAPGDKIIFTKNNHKLNIMNGQLGKITAINNNFMTISSNSKSFNIDMNNYQHLDYGYCFTGYKSQGMTVNKAIVNINSKNTTLNSRNAYYVNISRAKNGISIYTDNISNISNQIKQWQKKITSDDFLIKQSTSLRNKNISKNSIKHSILKKPLNAAEFSINSIKEASQKLNTSKTINSIATKIQSHIHL
ncbi:MobF family relaxase [Pectinatus brassicae]|uniref:Conjugative relaxase-like TrwC/TraI family protein n=1 Tax=Pectinatus brassicae TaxID=862415 RepID=A0A840UDL3_9FIRM|nr:MobF family relaxase [Pectinatus brassicae]MBB5335821.1 conjugative relaxase-like TrwC/TraI family protein [Pectinatus brassicae]